MANRGKIMNLFKKEEELNNPLKQNNYYTCYRAVLREKINNADGKDEFFQYIDNTYQYSYIKRKKFEHNHFVSEEIMIIFTFLATVLNALNLSLLKAEVISGYEWICAFFATVFTAGVTLVETWKNKRQYHESWSRHNIHYLDFLKECRDYVEDLNQYSGNISDKAKYELFKKTLYKIEDDDLDRFSENTARLK